MAKQKRKQWNEQELHQLFAERLPVLQIPDDFLDRLTESVLDEVERSVEQHNGHRGQSDSYSDSYPVPSQELPTNSSHNRLHRATTARAPHCKLPKRSMPPF